MPRYLGPIVPVSGQHRLANRDDTRRIDPEQAAAASRRRGPLPVGSFASRARVLPHPFGSTYVGVEALDDL